MKLRTLLLSAVAILGTVSPALAASPLPPDISDTSRVMPTGERVLQESIVLPAAPDLVWRLFATSEGLREWEAPLASIDLRIGGLMQASYQKSAVLGDDTTIVHEILAYVPSSLLVFRNIRSPKGFPWPERFQHVRNVVQIEAIDAAHSRLTISGVGYGAQDNALYDFFRSGNAYLLEALKAHLEGGPPPAGPAH
jgi:uncharacterized protein YndB with AHSA1/START domain